MSKIAALAGLSVGCAGAPRDAGTTPAAPAAPLAGPRVDHHQHLVSPAGADWLYKVHATTVALPPDLSRLVAHRAARWNDRAGLLALYTDDAVGFIDDEFGQTALRGAAVAEHVSTRFARPFRLSPTMFAARGDQAHLAGFLTRGEGAAARHFGRFYLEAIRTTNGWKIAVETLGFPGPRVEPTSDAAQLVSQLDAAGIERAVVLSVAYWFDSEKEPDTPEGVRRVRAENDWTAAQVARYPDRLAGFCSFNPLRDHAVAEVERCAAIPGMRGIKLHFGTSAVNLADPAHVDKVRRVFADADRRRMAIVVHLRGSDDYGAEHAAVFIERVLPAAPHVPVQVAHLWGGGAFSPDALAVFAEAVAARRPGTENLHFDISDAPAVAAGNAATLALMARRIRQIGVGRILYGSDAIGPGHPAPREARAQLLRDMPLTEEELGVIAGNAAPYLAPR